VSDNPTDLKIIKDAPSFIEKITEARFFCILGAFIFALDSALVYFARKNVLTLSTLSNTPEITIGNAIVFIGVFSFLIGICFPTLRTIGRYISGLPLLFLSAFDIMPFLKTSDPAFQSVFSAQRQAILERNEFALKLIDQHLEQQNKFEKQLDLIFGMTVLFACNLLVFGDQNVQTLSQVFASLLDQPMGFRAYQALWTIYLVFLFLTFGLSIYGLRPIVFTNDEIYLPKPEKKAPEVPAPPDPSSIRRLPRPAPLTREESPWGWGRNGNSVRE